MQPAQGWKPPALTNMMPRSWVFSVIPLAFLPVSTSITSCAQQAGKSQAMTRVPLSALSHIHNSSTALHVAIMFRLKPSSNVAHRPAAISDLPNTSKVCMMRTALSTCRLRRLKTRSAVLPFVSFISPVSIAGKNIQASEFISPSSGLQQK